MVHAMDRENSQRLQNRHYEFASVPGANVKGVVFIPEFSWLLFITGYLLDKMVLGEYHKKVGRRPLLLKYNGFRTGTDEGASVWISVNQ